ncbi:MAG: helix-turn-helix domain-containing protein [Nitrososphaeraceae archaeon]
MPNDGDEIALNDYLNRWGMKVCPIDRSLKILGQRYALHIMRNMILLKQNRFSAFLSSIEGISTKTLSIRLHQLEKYGLIERTVIPTKPTHTEYYPTEKGMAVQRILKEVASFSLKYEPEMIFVNESAKCNMESFLGVENLSEVYGSNE